MFTENLTYSIDFISALISLADLCVGVGILVKLIILVQNIGCSVLLCCVLFRSDMRRSSVEEEDYGLLWNFY